MSKGYGMKLHRTMWPRWGMVVAAAGLAACGGTSTGPSGGPGPAGQVSIAFRSAAAGAAAVLPGTVTGVSFNQTAGPLALTGSNGTLELDEVWLIIAEFKLKLANHSDCNGSGGESGDNDSCEKFSAPPQFLSLPLDGADAPVVTQTVPPDVYDKLKFEIEDIEVDEGEDGSAIQALFDEIRAQFADWPEKASMLAVGSFTPTGGSATPFRVFFEAEVEIEQEFNPPLDLTTGDATVTVVVDPALWFTQSDGTVLDLSQFDGQLVEFEAELDNGFSDVEVKDDGGSDS